VIIIFDTGLKPMVMYLLSSLTFTLVCKIGGDKELQTTCDNNYVAMIGSRRCMSLQCGCCCVVVKQWLLML
jgi:hypothetical protein